MINHGRHVFVSDSCSIFLVQCVMDIFYEVDVDQLVTPLLLSLGNGSIKIAPVPSTEGGVSFNLEFESSPIGVAGFDHKKFSVEGEIDNDPKLALRGGLIASMVGIRQTYGIYVGDYSYFKMKESYGLFARVITNLNSLCGHFHSMRVASHDYLKCALDLSYSLNQYQIGLTWFELKKAECSKAASKMLLDLK
jgi:hypothetical protein